MSGVQRAQVETAPLTREDKEDAGDKGQDCPVGTNVSNVAQDEADKHEEEADQGEWGGRANHF